MGIAIDGAHLASQFFFLSFLGVLFVLFMCCQHVMHHTIACCQFVIGGWGGGVICEKFGSRARMHVTIKG